MPLRRLSLTALAAVALCPAARAEQTATGMAQARTAPTVPSKWRSASAVPAALLGTFAASPAQCRSYNRRIDGPQTITSDAYTFCGGSGCEARIVGAEKTPAGYRLKLVGTFSNSPWSAEFREVQPDVIEVRVDSDPRIETIVRCTGGDIAAGVGLSDSDDGALTKSRGAAFSVFYAEAVPALCPPLRADVAASRKLVGVAIDAWELHLHRYNLQPVSPGATFRAGAEADILGDQQQAATAAKLDAEALPSFCEEAERAFGPNGRVIRNLLLDPRRKADLGASAAG